MSFLPQNPPPEPKKEVPPLTDFSALREGKASIGGRAFWTMITALVLWGAIGLWLNLSGDWPTACGMDKEGAEMLIRQALCAPHLFRNGVHGIALFAWFWTLPVGLIFAVLWRVRKARRAVFDANESGQS